jgi:endonuclease/exonuclease/phosphatase family metal-dependent hydrolase
MTQGLLRVATWNIHRGRGLLGPFRPGRIAEVIAEMVPDLLALQEAQHYFRRGDGMLDAEVLARDCGLRLLRVVSGEQGFRSNLLLARAHVLLRQGPIGLKLGGWEPRGAILAELEAGRGPFRVLAAHLSLGSGRRAIQAGALLAAARAAPEVPTLLLADINDPWPNGAALQLLAEGFGTSPSCPTYPAPRPLLALDRILSHPPGRVSAWRVHDTPQARRASDHLPLLASFDATSG